MAWVSLQDAYTGQDFGHAEQRANDAVTGQYHVLLPDNRVQLVKYKADGYGYVADVSYSEAGYKPSYEKGGVHTNVHLSPVAVKEEVAAAVVPESPTTPVVAESPVPPVHKVAPVAGIYPSHGAHAGYHPSVPAYGAYPAAPVTYPTAPGPYQPVNYDLAGYGAYTTPGYGVYLPPPTYGGYALYPIAHYPTHYGLKPCDYWILRHIHDHGYV